MHALLWLFAPRESVHALGVGQPPGPLETATMTTPETLTQKNAHQRRQLERNADAKLMIRYRPTSKGAKATSTGTDGFCEPAVKSRNSLAADAPFPASGFIICSA